MIIAVSGADGFIGRAVTSVLSTSPAVRAVRLIDRVPPVAPADPRFTALAADLTKPEALDAAVEGVDAVIHLASVPGGTAEADPALSRQVNVDVTLGLLERLDASPGTKRFIYASSIAVFGRLPPLVRDDTLPCPALVYGAHKRMVEIAVADFHRRGRVHGLSLRLPGIVARPPGASGLKSAFMSEVFHAGRAGAPFVMPVGPDATLWLMSAARAAANLVHAVLAVDLDGRALTLPVLRVRTSDLVDALFADPTLVRYDPDAALQAAFGAYPPLQATAAEQLGMAADPSLAALIQAAQQQW